MLIMSQQKLFPLTEWEVKLRSQELANAAIELSEMEEAKAAQTKWYGEQMKTLKSRIATLARIVRSESEWREALPEPGHLQEVMDASVRPGGR